MDEFGLERYLQETQTMVLISDLLRLSNGGCDLDLGSSGADGSVIAEAEWCCLSGCLGYG